MVDVGKFLETKDLTLSKDLYAGYNITDAYLKILLEEYAQIKIAALMLAEVHKTMSDDKNYIPE